MNKIVKYTSKIFIFTIKMNSDSDRVLLFTSIAIFI